METKITVINILLLLFLFSFISTAYAGDGSKIFWIDDNGTKTTWNDCESESALNGTSACTLATANANASAGDTIYLRVGNYVGTPIQPANSGTSDSNRIVFSNYNEEVVVISNTIRSPGILIDGKSYITVNGISVEQCNAYMYIDSGNHNIISYCKFDNGIYLYWAASRVSRSSQYNWIHHCSFTRWAGNSFNDNDGGLLDIGNNFRTDDYSFYNLIEDNTFAYGGHHVLGVYSHYNVIRNNYLHNEEWDYAGYRAAITEGEAAGRCLYEGNRFGFSGKSGMALRSHHNIFRFNSFYNNGSGGIQVVTFAETDKADYNHVYHNVFYHNGHTAYAGAAGGMYFSNWGRGSPIGNVVKNNIFYDNSNGSISMDGAIEPQIVINNWDQNDVNPGFVNLNGDDPNNPDLPDLRLISTSAAKDAGTWLTTITSANGSGNSFTVEDADYFMDGWGIIEGDLIQLEGQRQTARITNVDYDTKTITLDKSLTFENGQGISLAYEGSAPDLGAYEILNNDTILSPPTDLRIIEIN